MAFERRKPAIEPALIFLCVPCVRCGAVRIYVLCGAVRIRLSVCSSRLSAQMEMARGKGGLPGGRVHVAILWAEGMHLGPDRWLEIDLAGRRLVDSRRVSRAEKGERRVPDLESHPTSAGIIGIDRAAQKGTKRSQYQKT